MQRADVNFTFPKETRLKSSQTIGKVVSLRQSESAFPIKCFYKIEHSDSEEIRFKTAFIVPKKKFKHATDRNRTKRLMREVFRLNFRNYSRCGKNFEITLCWMFIGTSLPSYEDVENSMIGIFAQISGNLQNINL